MVERPAVGAAALEPAGAFGELAQFAAPVDRGERKGAQGLHAPDRAGGGRASARGCGPLDGPSAGKGGVRLVALQKATTSSQVCRIVSAVYQIETIRLAWT